MPITVLPELAAAFVLVFARVGTLVMLMPGLGERSAPARVRLALALLIALVFLPMARPLYGDLSDGARVPPLLFVELMVGFTLGITGRLLVWTLQSAGIIISQAIGLGFAETIDPSQSGRQMPVIGNLLALAGVAAFFAADLHHLVIRAMHDSFSLMPPGGMPASGDAAALFTRTLRSTFELAMRLAAPFLVIAILFNLGLGLLSRLMPQMQVFFVGLPATILAGLAVMALVFGAMMEAFVSAAATLLDAFTAR